MLDQPITAYHRRALVRHRGGTARHAWVCPRLHYRLLTLCPGAHGAHVWSRQHSFAAQRSARLSFTRALLRSRALCCACRVFLCPVGASTAKERGVRGDGMRGGGLSCKPAACLLALRKLVFAPASVRLQRFCCTMRRTMRRTLVIQSQIADAPKGESRQEGRHQSESSQFGRREPAHTCAPCAHACVGESSAQHEHVQLPTT